MIKILPYSLIVGQDELCRALEIGYVGGLGVLATGQRGTAKSTTIRAFSMLAYDGLPVTLPMGVTDDRVLGGHSIDGLLGPDPTARWQPGLLDKANQTGLLYIDEINLLDDHIVNLVLDAAAGGPVGVHRDNTDRPIVQYDFALVGSMNPDEGALRPQLLDRFALVVDIEDGGDRDIRRQILHNLLQYEMHRDDPKSAFMQQAYADSQVVRDRLSEARQRLSSITCPENVIDACALVAEEFRLVGHRGEWVMLRAARANAALARRQVVELDDLRKVAKSAVIHRRPNLESGMLRSWAPADEERLDKGLSRRSGER